MALPVHRHPARHRYMLVGLTLLFAATPLLAQNTAPRRPMTTDDGLDMVQVGNALMSPDGMFVFYRKSELDWDKNKRKSTYYMIPAEGGEPWQYIGEAGGSDFKFSPDGTYLAFKRSVDKKSQLFYMRTAGGEAVQLTKHKTSVGAYAWAEDSRTLFFVADEPRTDEEEKEHKNGHDAIIVDEGPNGQQAGRWRNLWTFDLESKKEARLTEGDRRISGFDVSPDGRRILFTARTENRRNQNYLTEIYLLTLNADTTITRLTENEAPESQVRWAPDGIHFAYSAADDQNWELRNNKIWLVNADTREHRMVSGAFEGNIRGYVWTPDSRHILFTGLQRTNSNLFRLNVSSGEVTRITDLTGTLSASSFSKDRTKMVYSFSDISTPSDLYVTPTDRLQPTRLTTANPAAVADSLLLADAEVIQWKSKDGREIEGILLLPPGYDRSERIPLLLHIHGGPAGVFTNSFRSAYHVWAGLGYAQLLPNVRGSSGYSDDLLRGNMHDIGGGDYWDLMTGVDYVIEQGIADPDRMGVRGWSYGGILGGWTITQTDRFKAASIGAMVSDWTSEYGPGFNYDVRLWYIGGTPWDNPEAWRQKSPLTHAKNVTTPTLILHGINDRTDTEAQSMMFFTALKDQGKTVRYIKFPREPHGFREPRHQRIRDIEEIRWMQKYVLGLEWKPWERKKKKDKEKEESDVAVSSL
ncbi:MAG: prolyl oligopeptidase family serine peptidase [Rhodothermales bacterium]